jgi:hypothetical protein
MEPRTEYRNGVLHVVYDDGEAIPLAEVMKFNYPDMDFDPATGDQIASAPPVSGSSAAVQSPVNEAEMRAQARAVVPQSPSFLSGTGLPERFGLFNDFFNPLAALPASMDASQRMFASDATGMERVTAGGDMLSGMAGVLAPVAGAVRAGTSGARALMEGLLGGSPTTQAAGDVARNFAADESGALKLFHGSPHDFDKFSMDKIGTGEGAQAYGRGLYFAENESVAKKYRDDLAGWATAGAERTLEAVGGDVDRAILETQEKLNGLLQRNEAGDFKGSERNFEMQRQIQQDKISQLINYKNTGNFDRGRMYEVNVGANPEDFLDWDLPLGEQPKRFQDLIVSREKERVAAEAEKLRQRGLMAAADLYDPNEITIERLARGKFAGSTGGDFVQSTKYGKKPNAIEPDLLREAGIAGVRYFDAGSRGATDKSRNYVVFDENLIDIVRKYGIATAAAMLGMSQADVAQAMQQQHPQPMGLLSGDRR